LNDEIRGHVNIHFYRNAIKSYCREVPTAERVNGCSGEVGIRRRDGAPSRQPHFRAASADTRAERERFERAA
jgi:hypothetical protein